MFLCRWLWRSKLTKKVKEKEKLEEWKRVGERERKREREGTGFWDSLTSFLQSCLFWTPLVRGGPGWLTTRRPEATLATSHPHPHARSGTATRKPIGSCMPDASITTSTIPNWAELYSGMWVKVFICYLDHIGSRPCWIIRPYWFSESPCPIILLFWTQIDFRPQLTCAMSLKQKTCIAAT